MNNLDSPTTSLRTFKCPSCEKDITIGIGIAPPEVLYAFQPADLEEKKKEFLSLIQRSTMTEDQKKQLIDFYGQPNIMLDPTVMATMMEEIRNRYMKIEGIIKPE